MKKGFTLAEVLVTLAVIGVVAALAIPALLQNTNDAQYKTAWKKAFAELSQVSKLIVQENGGTLVDVFPGDIAGGEALKDEFEKKFNVAKNCKGTGTNGGVGQGASTEGCWHGDNAWSHLNNSTKLGITSPGLVLSNGSFVAFSMIKSDCSSDTSSNGGDYTRCAGILVDINGFKKPNVIGKDIFHANLTKDTLIPSGARGFYDPSTDCDLSNDAGANNGWGCSALYLYGE